MYSGGVVVHCPGSLGAATAVLDAELPCSDRMLTKYTLERAKTVHHLDRVMSHTSRVVSHGGMTLKLKFPFTVGHERNGYIARSSDQY